jgi:hypothetical protein
MDNDFNDGDGGYFEKIETPGTGALNKRWIWAGGVGSGGSSFPRDSAAHGKFWGINNGQSEWYANCDNAFLVSPARDLGACSGQFTVAFDTWYQYHSEADGFLVEFWNGSSWYQVEPMEGWGTEFLMGSGCSPAPYIHGKPGFDKGCTGATSCTAWQTKHFVLSCDPCPSDFQVRFVHGADSSYATYGAHIDNLRFRKGVYYQGYSWYYGEQGQSCAAVCAQRGGYSDGTRAVSGSAGGDEHCQALLDALGAPSGFLGSGYPLDPGVGCVYVTSLAQRHRDVAFTTETANCSACRRVCACNE